MDPRAEAIKHLTALSQQTWEHPSGIPQPIDFADALAGILAAVAANNGGTDILLAGRPGSWEADLVRQLIDGTAPADELHRHRTEPLTLNVDPDAVLVDLGADALYWQETTAIETEIDRDDLSYDEQQRLELELEAVHTLHDSDSATYLAAYTQTIQATARDLGLTVDVNVVRVESTSPLDPDQHYDPLLERLHETAVTHTPLPNSGIAPKDYPFDGVTIADADRANGRTYRARAARQQQ